MLNEDEEEAEAWFAHVMGGSWDAAIALCQMDIGCNIQDCNDLN